MKNLKIGARIFVAFGVVVALMLLSAAVVFSTNMGIVDNVGKISEDSKLQTAGNTLKSDFLLARVAAIRLLSTTDAEVYDNFKKQADTATQNYTEIYSLISQNSFLEKFRPAFEQSESDFKAYLAKADELGKSNADEEAEIAKMNAAGALLEQYGDMIFKDQMQLLRDEIAAGSTAQDAQFRRADRVQSGADIALKVSTFRRYAREMMASFDTSNMQKALEIIDEAYALTEEYNKASTIAKNQENSKKLMDAIADYRSALVEFGSVCDNAAEISSELVPLGAASLESLTVAVDLLDDAMTEQVQNTTSSASSALITVMTISILSIFIAVVLAFVIMRSITVPVSKMVRAADSIALGDVNVDVHYESKDEIGALSGSFEKMLEGIKSQVSVVESLAGGDLTVDIIPRSDKDTMGHGLQGMVDKLNEMFADINGASDQVATGSKQIADGAQMLAQGSTEQASAVEELSASISQVAVKTRENTDMASKAAELAKSIKQNAEKGSAQMTNMMQAVKEINDASQNISKVIKVIDDIAFQTNILALNAAVEAARAGQHGKGFAVVADEVRNLAAKSAAAAKDTGGLIANSMEKAEYGSQIAQETANSLAEIVAGINESTRIVTEIAEISKEQSDSVSKINTGIDQVAQVVQQNSATAEESAAASEEMSGQSDMLREHIAQFKLKSKPSGGSRPKVHTSGESQGFALTNSDYSQNGEGYGKY